VPRPGYFLNPPLEEIVSFSGRYLSDLVGRVEVVFPDGSKQMGSCFLYSPKLYVLTVRGILFKSIVSILIMFCL